MNFKCNITKSPIDTRDVDADKVFRKLTLPDILDLRNFLNQPRDQGFQGTCAAHTAATMKEYQENKDIGFKNYFSPQFVYNLRENQESEGMYSRDVMKILHKIGIVEESDYPYELIEKSDKISEKLKNDASNHKIKRYGQIYTIESLKTALFKNGPCLIAFPVYNYSDRMWFENEGDTNLGGHAMTVVGYNKDGFIIRNSWGNNWADNGYCIYNYSDWGSHWEIWTTIDDKSEPEDNKPEPEDNKPKPEDIKPEPEPEDIKPEPEPDDNKPEPNDDKTKPSDDKPEPDDKHEPKDKTEPEDIKPEPEPEPEIESLESSDDEFNDDVERISRNFFDCPKCNIM